MATLAELGFKVDTSGLTNATGNLNKLSVAANNAETKANNSSAAIGQFGRKAGQAGMQVQQLVGQIQGGQNVFGAVSAQATDLGFVLGFPLLGAVVGIAAAFSGPLFSALLGTEQNAEDLTDQIDELTDGLKNATYAQRLFIAQNAAGKMEEEAETIRKAREELKKLEEQELRLITGKGRTGRMKAAKAQLDSISEVSLAITKQKAIIDTAQQAYNKYGDIISGVGDGEKDHADAIQKINEALKEELATTGATNAEVLRYRLEKEGATEKEIEAALAIQTSIDARKKQIEADKEAAIYAKALGVAQSKQGITARAAALKNFEALEQSLVSEEKALFDSYKRQKTIVANALGAEVADIKEAKKLIAAIDKKYAEDKEARELLVAQKTLSTSANMFGNLAAIAQAGGEDQFETWKRLAQAQAGISAALAALNVLKDPLVPTWLKGPAMAAIGALAAVQIAQIEQQQFTARELGGQVQPGQTVMVGERGPELITMGSMGGQVTSNKNLQQQSSPTIVLQVSTGVTSTVRAEMASMMPFITKSLMTAMRAR